MDLKINLTEETIEKLAEEFEYYMEAADKTSDPWIPNDLIEIIKKYAKWEK